MKLLDLDPQWLMQDGKRIGFTFVSPAKPEWRQSCFAVAGVSHGAQRELFGDDADRTQCCNPRCAWTLQGGIESADFGTLTVTPSLDGSAGGLCHGFITDGQIK